MNCKICGESCEEQDFCYGCQSYVCQKCSDTYPDVPGGKHTVADHVLLRQALADLRKAQEAVDKITGYSDFLTEAKKHG